MLPLVPQVHLFVCLDSRIAPGVVLHALDLARAQDWQQETVLICDESWSHRVNIDQPVMFIDKGRLFNQGRSKTHSYNVEVLEALLEQLDHFEITQVTQIGELNWGRWLIAYFEQENNVQMNHLVWSDSEISSLHVMNEMSKVMGLDVNSGISKSPPQSAVYVDPYEGSDLSPGLVNLLEEVGSMELPQWLIFAVDEKDEEFFNSKGLSDWTVERGELEMSLFNQSVFCFDEGSPFVQTSRSYNVAILSDKADEAMYLPGDIQIKTKENIHLSELANILVYWKSRRLRELAFQWMNMGIEINIVEDFHGRLIKRNLLNYSTDLFNSQTLVKYFVERGDGDSSFHLSDLVDQLRLQSNRDPYTLSFSLKILQMIVDRMIASAKIGERLFQRLGSDYHRLIIGEALVEGLIQVNSQNIAELKIDKKLNEFREFLMKVDYHNDMIHSPTMKKGTL